MNTNSNILNITHAKSITVQTHTINCQKRSFIILLSNSISCHSLPIVMICSFSIKEHQLKPLIQIHSIVPHKSGVIPWARVSPRLDTAEIQSPLCTSRSQEKDGKKTGGTLGAEKIEGKRKTKYTLSSFFFKYKGKTNSKVSCSS